MTKGESKARPTGGGFAARAPDHILTPETLGAEAELLADAAAAFMRGEVLPAADRIEAREPGLLPELLRRAGALGLLATDIPESFDGLGLLKSTSGRIAEALAAEPSFAVSHSVHSTVASLPIVFYGSLGQKWRFLPHLASGELIGAYALSESQSASDALSMRTRAVPSADGTSYTLSGEKMWITNAAFAGMFIVFAKVDEAITAFIVERDRPGLAIGREEHKLGLKGSSTCRLVLDDVTVPAENRLGDAGDGGKIALTVLNIGRFKIAATAVGQSKNLLGIATRYANQRKAFGKPISGLGLIQQKLATMAARTFAAESMLYHLGGLLNGAFAGIDPMSDNASSLYRAAAEEYAIECALTKVACTETLDYIADETLQIHGGYGYTEEYAPARAWRDARVTRIYEGTNEVNRLNVISLLARRIATGRLTLPAIDPHSDPLRALFHTLWPHVNARWPELHAEQEVCGSLADVLIALFAAESASMRADSLSGEKSRLAHLASDQVLTWSVDVARRSAEAIRSELTEDREIGRALARVVDLIPTHLIAGRKELAQSVSAEGGFPW